MQTLREILSDGQFESDSRTLIRKPAFFFGDSIEEDETVLYDGNYKWLRRIGDRKFFLANMDVTPRSRRYGDIMATYIREVKTPSRVR